MEILVQSLSNSESRTIPVGGKGEITVGRGSTCDVVLQGTYVSRVHCLVSRDAHGAWWITPRGMNPMLLNGAELAREEPSPLRLGDRLQLGEFVLTLREDDASRSDASGRTSSGAIAAALR